MTIPKLSNVQKPCRASSGRNLSVATQRKHIQDKQIQCMMSKTRHGTSLTLSASATVLGLVLQVTELHVFTNTTTTWQQFGKERPPVCLFFYFFFFVEVIILQVHFNVSWCFNTQTWHSSLEQKQKKSSCFGSVWDQFFYKSLQTKMKTHTLLNEPSHPGSVLTWTRERRVCEAKWKSVPKTS